MTVLHVHAINKKDQQLHLSGGQVIGLSVERMFEVGMYLDQQEIGRIRFEALSSLNNPEISPLYKLHTCHADHPLLKRNFKEIMQVALDLFRQYTNGRIRLGADLEPYGLS